MTNTHLLEWQSEIIHQAHTMYKECDSVNVETI